MKVVKLTPITEPYTFYNVEMAHGKTLESFYFKTGEAWVDSDGTIRTFSQKFENGLTKNYFLFPKDLSKDAILSIVDSGLAEFGLKLIGESLLHGSTVIHSLGNFLFYKHGNKSLKEYLTNQKEANLGYIEITSRQVVINKKLNIKDGFPISAISYSIKNDASVSLKYEISKDRKKWETFELFSGTTMSNYFSSGNKKGYIRLYTNNKGYQEYIMYAKNTYVLDWNDKKECWDIFHKQ